MATCRTSLPSGRCIDSMRRFRGQIVEQHRGWGRVNQRYLHAQVFFWTPICRLLICDNSSEGSAFDCGPRTEHVCVRLLSEWSSALGASSREASGRQVTLLPVVFHYPGKVCSIISSSIYKGQRGYMERVTWRDRPARWRSTGLSRLPGWSPASVLNFFLSSLRVT